jgi:hypothetical protein
MKHSLPAASLAFAAFVAASPALATCSSCNIQTKTPSATGKFDYRVSCIIDESGDEVNTVVTAANDEEAIELTKRKGR